MSGLTNIEEQFFNHIIKGIDFDLHGESVRGDVISDWLVHASRNDFFFPRGLQLRNGIIKGNLNFESIKFPFPIYIKNCTCEGIVVLRSIETKTISFEGSLFEEVLDARDCKIDGQVVLRDCEFKRPVLFRDSIVTGMLNTLGASFTYDPLTKSRNWMEDHAWGDSFSLARSQLGSLTWKNITKKPLGQLNFTDTKLGTFYCNLDELNGGSSFPTEKKVLLDGFLFERIEQNNIDRIIDLYNLMPAFSPSAWRNLALSLKHAGLDHDADLVAAKLRKLEIRHMKSPWKRWFYLSIFAITGYGLHAERALLMVMVCFFSAYFLALFISHNNYLSPKVNSLLLTNCYYSQKNCGVNKVNWKKISIMPNKEERYIPVDYPMFSPIRYTTESFLPFIKGEQSGSWQSSLPLFNILNNLLGTLAIFFSGIFFGTISGLFFPNHKN